MLGGVKKAYPMQKIKIQIVEDESIFARDLEYQLVSMNFSVVSISDTGEQAIKEAEKVVPDLILMDIRLKGKIDGIETSQKIRSHNNIPVIFLTAYADEQTLKRAKFTEPFGYLLKPINKRELKAVIEMALYKHRMEKKLWASEERFRRLVENTMDLLFVIDSHTNIVDINQTACRKSGYNREELLELTMKDIGIGDQKIVKKIIQQLTYTRSLTVEDAFQCKDGTTFPVEIHIGLLSTGGNPLLLALARDITSRQKREAEKIELEKQLLRSQKLEELGRLAGGVAHDFNNMLTVIQGYSDMALLHIEQSSPLYTDLKEIRDAAYRSASLTRQLLLFSRHQPVEYSLLNINTLIKNLIQMLNRILGENVVIKTELKNGLWDVWGDLGSIEQAIMNLTINAKESILGKGKITIKTDNTIIDKSNIDTTTDAKPGKYVVIEVKDTGAGMDVETLKHIFTPFFTTKGQGKGTGLGLSVVNDIVKNNNGWIRVDSQLGKGSIFTLYLPASFREEEKKKEEIKDLQDLKGHGEHILLVEDEESVREYTSTVMQNNGYTVTTAATTKQALANFNKKKNDFQLLFTDMVLPDKTGLELAKHIRLERPDIPVLLSSGYTDENLGSIRDREEMYEFIQKPYDMVNILRAVKRILNLAKK